MEKTLIIWRRLGKEHGENAGYRKNPEEVIQRHLDEKQTRYQETAASDWCWWKIDDALFVETSTETNALGDPVRYYYLPQKNWLLVENFNYGSPQVEWKWYIHIGKMHYDPNRTCWIFTDWFSDVLVMPDGRTHTVLDLDDLGHGYQLGLITSDEMVEILVSTQALVDSIRNGQFPPAEIEAARGLMFPKTV